MPAFLAVGSLGAASACGGDDGTTTAADTSADDADDDGSSGPSTADDDAASTGPSDSSSVTVSSDEDGSSTRGDETSTDSTGGDYCFGDGSNPSCDVTEQSECEGIEVCVWTEPGYCSANCAAITDRTQCCDQFECEWQFGVCDYGAI